MTVGYEEGSDGNWYFKSTHKVTRDVARAICESAPKGQLAEPVTEPETIAMAGYKGN